jgi:hypothetical protein
MSTVKVVEYLRPSLTVATAKFIDGFREYWCAHSVCAQMAIYLFSHQLVQYYLFRPISF